MPSSPRTRKVSILSGLRLGFLGRLLSVVAWIGSQAGHFELHRNFVFVGLFPSSFLASRSLGWWAHGHGGCGLQKCFLSWLSIAMAFGLSVVSDWRFGCKIRFFSGSNPYRQ